MLLLRFLFLAHVVGLAAWLACQKWFLSHVSLQLCECACEWKNTEPGRTFVLPACFSMVTLRFHNVFNNSYFHIGVI